MSNEYFLCRHRHHSLEQTRQIAAVWNHQNLRNTGPIQSILYYIGQEIKAEANDNCCTALKAGELPIKAHLRKKKILLLSLLQEGCLDVSKLRHHRNHLRNLLTIRTLHLPYSSNFTPMWSYTSVTFWKVIKKPHFKKKEDTKKGRNSLFFPRSNVDFYLNNFIGKCLAILQLQTWFSL